MDPQSKQETKYKVKGMWGIIADKMDVGTAKLRGDESANLDVAIIKATLNDEVVPKEKHVRTLKVACAGSVGRQEVNYVIHGLGQRLEGNKDSWLVTLKTLIVFHRLLREVDPSFQAEMLKYAERTGNRRMLRLDTFADHTTKDTWDFSAWIRVYSVYLDERLEVFRVMKFDPEQEETAESKLKTCATPDLLERLPLAHKLMSRLIACVPQGSAVSNEIVAQSCGLVLKEVRAVYRMVCEGVMNLADKFFEMERNDAVRGLELYKENIALNDRLNAFFNSINNIGSMKGLVQFPTLQSLPADFLTTLEEYVRDAPKVMDGDSTSPGGNKAPPPATVRSSTMVKQGGVTSSAITGEAPAMGTAKASGAAATHGISLHIGAPIQEPPVVSPSAAPSAAQEIDLLGADLSEMTVAAPAAPPAGQQQQPQQPPGGDAFFATGWGAAAAPPAAQAPSMSFGESAFGAAAAAGPGSAAPAPPAARQAIPSDIFAPANPFNQSMGPNPAATTTASPLHQSYPPAAGAYAGPPQQGAPAGNSPYPWFTPAPGSQPPAGAPPAGYALTQQPVPPLHYGGPAGFGASPQMYGQPGQQAPPPTSPYPAAAPAAPANPFVGMGYPQAAGSNPFGGGAPAAPAAPVPWAVNTDPLSNLSFDILGKAAGQPAPQPTLREMRGQPAHNGVPQF